MLIQRQIASEILRLRKKFPVISLTGPRQAGKTTLLRQLLSDYSYVSLEDIEQRDFAQNDPRSFLKSLGEHAIIDEAQKVPDLFSYIQGIVDDKQIMGQFVLSGSQNFLLLESITQSLAGRVAVLKLLGFSYEELSTSPWNCDDLNRLLWTGLYPPIYDRKLNPQDWYASYLLTYLERDVRSIKNIVDLDSFQKFLKLCAARTGQLLNMSNIGNECGISHNTVKEWLSILQASYVVFMLQPYHESFNKRIVKQPKLYFYDTGLLCFLLDIRSPEELVHHPMRGQIFESFVVAELVKNQWNTGGHDSFYFWRDSQGHEVDCLVARGQDLIPIEIKSGQTILKDFFKGLGYWNKITQHQSKDSYLIYGGELNQTRGDVQVSSWKSLTSDLFKA